MRSVVLGVGSSFDSYIARPDGTVDFLQPDPAYSFKEFMDSIDATIMGRKTYEVAMKMGGGFGGKMPSYVLSRTLPANKKKNTHFTDRSPAAVVAELRQSPGKDIWLMGGGELAREFLKADLIDRIDLGVMPCLIGSGIPLFPAGFPERQFSLAKSKTYPSGMLELRYVRAR